MSCSAQAAAPMPSKKLSKMISLLRDDTRPISVWDPWCQGQKSKALTGWGATNAVTGCMIGAAKMPKSSTMRSIVWLEPLLVLTLWGFAMTLAGFR